MSEEMDVIQHLLEIEKAASEILVQAQADADRKIAETKAKADGEFKEKFSAYMDELDRSADSRRKDVRDRLDSELATLKSSLDSTAKDVDGFNSLFEQLING